MNLTEGLNSAELTPKLKRKKNAFTYGHFKSR